MDIKETVPTWFKIMPALIALIENGTLEGKLEAKQDLMELALKVDEMNKAIRGNI